MSVLGDFFGSLFELISSNLYKIIFSAIAVIIVYVVYKFLSRQITRLKSKKDLRRTSRLL